MKRKSIAIVMAALMAIAVLSSAGVAAADGGHHHKDKLLKFDVFTDPKHKHDDDKKVGTFKQEKKDKDTFELNAKGLKEKTKYSLVFEFKDSDHTKTIEKKIKTDDDGKIKDKDVKIDRDFAKWADKKGDDAGHFELVKA